MWDLTWTNFARQIYPTLKEREEFAISACDYVDTKLEEQSKILSKDQNMAVIVSFSFVNTDLRDIFRQRFPFAEWVLLDTTESEANTRIETREGHFYKGAPPQDDNAKPPGEESPAENSEWNFAPVTFPVQKLPGDDPIAANAQRVVDIIRKELNR